MPGDKNKKTEMPSKEASLKISAAEREMLLEVLRESLGTLREQVYHTDTASFKDQLKAKEGLLQGLISKIS